MMNVRSPRHVSSAVVGLALAVAATGALSAPSGTAGASAPTKQAPVAVTGSLPSGDQSKVVRVAAYVDQENAVMAKAQGGAPLPFTWLPASSVVVSGATYSLKVDPSTLPANVVDAAGMVTFHIVTFDKGGGVLGLGAGSARAVLDSTGQVTWADPLAATTPTSATPAARTATTAVPEGTTLDTLPPQVTPAPVTADVSSMSSVSSPSAASLAAAAVDDEFESAGTDGVGEAPQSTLEPALEGAPAGTTVCFGAYVKRERKRSTTIGTAYPIGGDNAWMTHMSGSSHSYNGAFGIAAATASSNWNFGSSQSSSVSASSGFDWNGHSYARSFRVGVWYQKVFSYFTQRSCDSKPDVVYWKPNRYTGGYGENRDGVTRPSWTKCVRMGSDGIWWRDRSDGHSYSLSYGVKFADVIGLDLSSTRAYNQEARLAYNLAARGRWLCGNNATPGTAGKVMERLNNAP